MSLAASQAWRWIKCSMSGVGVGPAPPHETPSDAEIEGRAAHWVAECVLLGDAFSAHDLIGRLSPDGHEITADMAKHVQGYIDVVLGSEIESRFSVDPNIEGRADAVRSADTYLMVYEFKYGWQIVEPAFNPQLMLAAAGFLKPSHHTVMLVVYQPRPFHPQGMLRIWTVPREIIEYHVKFIKERAALALGVNPQATPGNHCINCRKAGVCRALAITVFEVSEHPGMANVPVEFLGREWNHLRRVSKMLTARLNALSAEIEARLNANEYVPGVMFKDRVGRKWKGDPRVIEAFTGMKLHKIVTLTPAQAEKEGYEVDGFITNTVSRDLAPATAREMEKIFAVNPGTTQK